MPDTPTTATTDPVADAFAALVRALRTAAIDAPIGSEREAAFHAAARRISERWTAGEASPIRAGKREG
jgi:hypothetical protein